VERELYARGFDAGWVSGELELGGGLEELDRGKAPTEQVKLPYTVAMSDLAGLYDFKRNRSVGRRTKNKGRF